MDKTMLTVFLLLVFGAVFLLAQFLIVPNFGTSQHERKRLKKRLSTLADDDMPETPMFLLRERFRRKPSGLERVLSWIPGMQALAGLMEQPGRPGSGYVYVLVSVVLAGLGGAGAWYLTGKELVSVLSFLGAGWLPWLKLKIDEARRFNRFEEQLVGALEVMTRALLAGYPFSETLRQVAKEMEDPIATEFQITFDEINAGVEVRKALRNMLNRTPSMTLMALTTTVALQRETGGNLAESLTNIGGVIRGRFKFQRRVSTLTAEGRMSAWVLALTPFVLFGVMSVMMPTQIRAFVADPMGQQMIMAGLGLMVAGIVWLRKLLAIEI